jgi:ABC-type multidrug transport system ATPase subunit
VDVETEARLQEALAAARRGRTNLIVAQRISTVLSADQILVLDNGQIVAQRIGSGTVTYLHGDHLGSVAVTSDGSGGAIQRQFFDPWGKIRQGGTP